MLPKSALNSLPDEYSKFSQKDKDEIMKNMVMQEDMDKLIKMFKKRDTKGNIQKLQDQLDSLQSQQNPIKKCLSMYKIKEKMDEIQNNTLQEEK